MPPRWLEAAAKPASAAHRNAAWRRQAALTKPAGALGDLESAAVQLAALQHRHRPRADRVHIAVFAADHGVAARGVSAWPQSVTVEMLRNFAAGGAAVSVIADALDATLEIIDAGTVAGTVAADAAGAGADPIPGVTDARIAAGTRDFSVAEAMTAAQLQRALALGRDAVMRAPAVDLFIGGDMGIANTTAAAAVACAILHRDPADLSGPGAGLDAAGVARKTAVIAAALDHHRGRLHDPRDALRCLGGFEIAALTGAFIAAAQNGIAVVVDGFIAGAAALAAARINPTVRPWLLFGHRSAEPGHACILDALEAKPLLDLGLRLGEGSGAAAAVCLLRLACRLHNDMATFVDAGVSGKHRG